MLNEEESYNIMNIKEADSRLERYRKDIIEKYIEYEIVKMLEFKERGKSFDDFIVGTC